MSKDSHWTVNNFVIPFSRVEEKWEKNGVGGKPREFHVGYVNFELFIRQPSRDASSVQVRVWIST